MSAAGEQSRIMNHGHFTEDGYENLKFDLGWQRRIIRRENDIYDKWTKKIGN